MHAALPPGTDPPGAPRSQGAATRHCSTRRTPFPRRCRYGRRGRRPWGPPGPPPPGRPCAVAIVIPAGISARAAAQPVAAGPRPAPTMCQVDRALPNQAPVADSNAADPGPIRCTPGAGADSTEEPVARPQKRPVLRHHHRPAQRRGHRHPRRSAQPGAAPPMPPATPLPARRSARSSDTTTGRPSAVAIVIPDRAPRVEPRHRCSRQPRCPPAEAPGPPPPLPAGPAPWLSSPPPKPPARICATPRTRMRRHQCSGATRHEPRNRSRPRPGRDARRPRTVDPAFRSNRGFSQGARWPPAGPSPRSSPAAPARWPPRSPRCSPPGRRRPAAAARRPGR